MSILKSAWRWVSFCVLPAAIITVIGAGPLMANRVVQAGTTTTYNGAPACDCSNNNSQCGCVSK